MRLLPQGGSSKAARAAESRRKTLPRRVLLGAIIVAASGTVAAVAWTAARPGGAPGLPASVVAAAAPPDRAQRFEQFREAAIAARQHLGDASLSLEAGGQAAELGRYRDGLGWFRHAAKLDPKLLPAVTGQGQMWMALGRPGRAAHAYERALKLAPDVPEIWIEASRAYSRLRDFQAALRCARRAEKLSPDAEVHRALASIYAEMMDPEQCLASAKKACEVEPANAENWVSYAGFLLRNQHYPEAETAFQRALKLEPANVSANVLYAKAVADGRKTPEADREAFALLSRARAVEPEHTLALLLQGQIATRAGNLPLAVSLLREARETDPRNSEVLIALGQALVRSGKTEEGVTLVTRGQQLGPRGVGFSGLESQALQHADPNLTARLVDLYLRQHLYDSAYHVLARALRDHPGNAALTRKLVQVRKADPDPEPGVRAG